MLRRGTGIGASSDTRDSGMGDSVRGRPAPLRSIKASTPDAARSTGRSNGATVSLSRSTSPTRRSPAIENVATRIGALSLSFRPQLSLHLF